jgi:hypothetical protein
MNTEVNAHDKMTRLEIFARFFKNYLSVSSIITAALPIPVTAMGLIATYKFQTKVLSMYTSLFCFLVLAFIFYSRHRLALFMFPEFSRIPKKRFFSILFVKLLPLLLIVCSLMFVFMYQRLLSESMANKRISVGLPASEVTDTAILEISYLSQTPEASLLMIFYLGIFVTAESAFVLMAIREYLQDLLQFSETELIRGRKTVTHKETEKRT